MEFYFVLFVFLYLILGFGFSKVMKKTKHHVPSFANLIIWPVGLLFIAIDPDWD